MAPPYVCIHGHFYQPPRENPWLEEIEVQDSAHPYHDWNHRINAECYARNAAARILDDEGRIVRITNNYARMSFNFGPTLLSWMSRHSPEVYAAVLAADRRSRDRFGGHGSAMAQPYNHMILPLANRADRTTQILWGIRDFQHRFGRSPEGMWLPEAAVDLETLDIMAEMGIAFTVLSPHQAQRVRPADEEAWTDVSDGGIDPRRPYLQRLPEGRGMAIFFYDGVVSRDVAFGGLLRDGETLAGRLIGAVGDNGADPPLVHIATDGETFGHHHRFGDMALAYALERIDAGEAARLTNYAAFLEMRPPDWEVEIKENSAWSCAHGLERWKSDCGCSSGREPGWHQRWRTPLRVALDWLRDRLAETYAEEAGSLFDEPWRARNDYIEVVLDRSPENIDRFLCRQLTVSLDDTSRIRALKLLEMQRQAMLMYTSCGWFFDDLSGIETVQILQYAGRAVQLARELVGSEVEEPFLVRLAAAESNIPRHGNGRRIYEKWVRPAGVDLKKAGAHYAISSLFEAHPETAAVYCFSMESEESRSAEAGKSRLAWGRVRITSRITRESDGFHYAALHMGDHNISCGIRGFDETAYRRMASEVPEIFDKGDITALFQCIGEHFPGTFHSLVSMFRDEQRKALDTILEATTSQALAMYRQLYENNVALMRFIRDSSSRLPAALSVAGEIVVNNDLNEAFGRDRLDLAAIGDMIDAAQRAGVELDADTLEFTLRRNLQRLSRELAATPEDLDLLERLILGTRLTRDLPFQLRLQEIQNRHYQLWTTLFPAQRQKADAGDPSARQWVEMFLDLSRELNMRTS